MIELPAELRLDPPVRPEAAGTRAFATLTPTGACVVIDDNAVELSYETRLGGASSGAIAVWPHALVREAASARETLIVSPDRPVALLRLEGERRQVFVTRRTDTTVLLDGHPLTESDVLLPPDATLWVVSGRDPTIVDAEAVAGSAIARMRRRAALRPRVRLAGSAIDLAGAEHAVRLALARDATGALRLSRRGADRDTPAFGDDATLAAALALLALNDADTAATLIDAIADVRGEIALVVAGAWSSWRGRPLERQRVVDARVPVGEAIAATGSAIAAGALGPVHRLARAFAPAAADASGDAALAERMRTWQADDLARSIAQLGRSLAAAGPTAGMQAILDVVHGQLGIVPDAVRGRVRFTPLLALGNTTIEGLVVGDATIALRCEVAHGRASIEAEQTAGPTPLTAILEPTVPGRSLKGAEVDGHAADLDSTRSAAGLETRVQLVLDEARRLELDFEPL